MSLWLVQGVSIVKCGLPLQGTPPSARFFGFRGDVDLAKPLLFCPANRLFVAGSLTLGIYVSHHEIDDSLLLLCSCSHDVLWAIGIGQWRTRLLPLITAHALGSWEVRGNPFPVRFCSLLTLICDFQPVCYLRLLSCACPYLPASDGMIFPFYVNGWVSHSPKT